MSKVHSLGKSILSDIVVNLKETNEVKIIWQARLPIGVPKLEVRLDEVRLKAGFGGYEVCSQYFDFLGDLVFLKKEKEISLCEFTIRVWIESRLGTYYAKFYYLHWDGANSKKIEFTQKIILINK